MPKIRMLKKARENFQRSPFVIWALSHSFVIRASSFVILTRASMVIRFKKGIHPAAQPEVSSSPLNLFSRPAFDWL